MEKRARDFKGLGVFYCNDFDFEIARPAAEAPTVERAPLLLQTTI